MKYGALLIKTKKFQSWMVYFRIFKKNLKHVDFQVHSLMSGIEDSNSTSLTITVTENLTFTASFITSPTNLIESLQVTIISPSWYANDWLGYFYQSDNGWCYHYNLGWIFPETQSDGSIWLWSPQLKWLWLNSDSFTKQQSWSATDENWIYFDFESLPSPRFFRYKDEIWSPFDKNQEVSILDGLF